jgi:hypothetical protein
MCWVHSLVLGSVVLGVIVYSKVCSKHARFWILCTVFPSQNILLRQLFCAQIAKFRQSYVLAYPDLHSDVCLDVSHWSKRTCSQALCATLLTLRQTDHYSAAALHNPELR